MPITVVEPFAFAPVVGPTVVRIGPDRTLLDAPWEMLGCTVANVWPDDRVAGGWARVEWPRDGWSGRPIAPLDLHFGHTLAVGAERNGRWISRYATVADVDDHRVVLAAAASAAEAASIARRAVDAWRATELAAAELTFRRRTYRG